MSKQPILLDKRWEGGPLICADSNLPAFKTPKDRAQFEAENCPGCTVLAKWLCSKCGHWHYFSVGTGPAGGNSGVSRGSKMAEFYQKNPKALVAKLKDVRFE